MDNWCPLININGYDFFAWNMGFKEIIKVPSFNTEDPCTLAGGFAFMEKYKLRVNEVIMDVNFYTSLLKNKVLPIDTRGILEQIERLERGILNDFWGAYICVSEKIPPGYLLFLSELKHGVNFLFIDETIEAEYNKEVKKEIDILTS